jgi:formate dehydrogenase major subunit
VNADCIVLEGSNMAECHPVGFQWVMEARERGATIIHVDPRFTRTSAVADEHVPIRVGTDIAFLGGLINHVLQGDHWFREYVEAYTNASTIVDEGYEDSEDLDGVFVGWDEESKSYDPSHWGYEGMEPQAAAGERGQASQARGGERSHGAHGAGLEHGEPPETDPTLQHPRCVFQVLKRHFARYTPEYVEAECGISRAQFARVADAVVRNSGRERTTAWVYSVGWTHHTTGTQYIRAASILQLLLGNIGRPGGGILALRGHASIQGSTDIPTLYNILPGYLPMPHAEADVDLDDYLENNTPPGGYWGHTREYMVSLLKAWWGDAATAENEFGFHLLPRISGDHSIYPMVMGMRDGEVEGFFVMGENPAVGSANAKLHRLGMANLKWLVVRDLQMIESATFWKDGPEIATGELRTQDIGTEVFFLPGAAHTEKEGSFTNTQRLLQWRDKALESPGDCRSELHFMFHLVRRIREKLAGSAEPRDRAILDLTWDYSTHGAQEEPSAHEVLREISGYAVEENTAVSGYTDLKGDGSTACGCWIYSGVYADEVNQAARRRPGREQTWVAPEWGWAWPMNRRILYNRAAADPDGNPWSERKKYVWWDADQGRWTGDDVPDFKEDKAPDYVPGDDAEAEMALRGDEPFVLQADGKGWLYVPSGLLDGPLPVHYEPHESPVRNLLHPRVQASPTRQQFPRPDNPYNPTAGDPGADVFPFAFMTYRIAEHHTAGGMSRFLPYLSELAPSLFVEVSPELAALRDLEHGGWSTVITTRTAVEARVLVTERMRPQRVQGGEVHTVGMPYHWGSGGLATGDTVNDLLPLVLDRNVHISEFKAATCDIQPGRRPQGAALLELVDAYRRRAGIGGEPPT